MNKTRLVKSTGNVFADLKLSDPQGALAKAELVHSIRDIIETAGFKQKETARILGIDQPKVSALLRGQTKGFSTDRLINFLLALGRDVEIHIKKPKSTRRPARIIVKAA